MMSSTKLKPITTFQSLICLSLKTPIYEAKEKKLELTNLKMGQRMKRQAACQTVCFDNNIYFRKTLSSHFQQPGKHFSMRHYDQTKQK
ncbi:unnamed protein product [Paramecium octaurelia]|uniref:Uncharacterized protein n=1 Tax=Paramecium octaurelia TaxID=43137 RepID=A0A8S1VLI7_PAROT|nr:unnamed protein product [Paramecium octaurelia]